MSVTQPSGSLQCRQAAQRIGLLSTCARKHRADGPETNDALTFRPDHPKGVKGGAKVGQ